MVTALTCTSGIVTVWHVLVAWLQYWQLQYTKRAPLVNSSDVGPMTRLSVDTSDHRDVRTVTWNHGYDGLWSESHVLLLLLSQSGVCQFTFLTGFYQFTFPAGVYQFTLFTGSALTCWTHTVCHQYRDTLNAEYSVGSSSSSLQHQANTATSTTSNDIIC